MVFLFSNNWFSNLENYFLYLCGASWVNLVKSNSMQIGPEGWGLNWNKWRNRIQQLSSSYLVALLAVYLFHGPLSFTHLKISLHWIVLLLVNPLRAQFYIQLVYKAAPFSHSVIKSWVVAYFKCHPHLGARLTSEWIHLVIFRSILMKFSG